MQEINLKIIEHSHPGMLIPKEITELKFKDDPTPYLRVLKKELMHIYNIHLEHNLLPRGDRRKNMSLTWLMKDVITGIPIQLTEGASSVLFDLQTFFQHHYKCMQDVDHPHQVNRRGLSFWTKYKMAYTTWDYYLGRLLGPTELVLEQPKLNLPQFKKNHDLIPIYPIEYEFHLLLGKFNGREILTLILIFVLIRVRLLQVVSSRPGGLTYHGV